MSTASLGAPPDSAKADAPAAPAAPSVQPSSLPANENFNSKVKAANSPAELRKIMNDLAANPPAQSAKPAEVPPKPDEKSSDGKPQETETSAPGGTPESTPETPETSGGETPEKPEGEPETPAGDAKPDDDPEGKPEVSDKNRFRIRVKSDDRVGKLAISMMRGDPDLTMEEALTNARAELGIKTQPTEQPKPVERPANPSLPATLDEVDSAIKNLRSERKKAMTVDLDFNLVAEIDDKLSDLTNHRFDVIRETERQQVAQVESYNQGFASSERKASELYDFASQPESEGAKRMVEIENELEANNDPLYFDPEKPLIIAQMVAKELKIAPKRKGAPTAAPAKPAAPAPAAQKKQVLPGGSSATVPPKTQPNGEIVKEISGIKSVADLRNFNKKLGVRDF